MATEVIETMRDDKENKIQPLQGEQSTTPNSSEGASTASVSAWKRLLAKKWVFPATYMAAAAIILTLMWAYQDSATTPTTEEEIGLEVDGTVTDGADAVPTVGELETLRWPVADMAGLEVTMEYFDVNNSQEDLQAAMVEYGDTFTPHMGVDLSSPNGETFEVYAAMSGTVTRVENVPVVGQLIEITHENGMSTMYQSIEDIQVAKGDKVKQGDLIAAASSNELEKDLGVHLHFEVWNNGEPVNPEQFIQE